eukprot:4784941-Heterocapsa_arctica.AAC.1
MVDSFSHENAAYCMDLLGSLELFAGDTKKDKNNNMYNFNKGRQEWRSSFPTQRWARCACR